MGNFETVVEVTEAGVSLPLSGTIAFRSHDVDDKISDKYHLSRTSYFVFITKATGSLLLLLS